jgi:hypothetical protein
MNFDKLAYVDRLKAAGFNEPQARAMADGLDQALREEVATKSDVAALRTDVRGEIAEFRTEVRGEIAELRTEVRGEIAELRNEMGLLRTELRAEFNGGLIGLRGEMGAMRGELLAAMKADKIDLLKWVVMLIVGQTAVFTALKLLGH